MKGQLVSLHRIDLQKMLCINEPDITVSTPGMKHGYILFNDLEIISVINCVIWRSYSNCEERLCYFENHYCEK